MSLPITPDIHVVVQDCGLLKQVDYLDGEYSFGFQKTWILIKGQKWIIHVPDDLLASPQYGYQSHYYIARAAFEWTYKIDLIDFDRAVRLLTLFNWQQNKSPYYILLSVPPAMCYGSSGQYKFFYEPEILALVDQGLRCAHCDCVLDLDRCSVEQPRFSWHSKLPVCSGTCEEMSNPGYEYRQHEKERKKWEASRRALRAEWKMARQSLVQAKKLLAGKNREASESQATG